MNILETEPEQGANKHEIKRWAGVFKLVIV
jgi:hypothetical protein